MLMRCQKFFSDKSNSFHCQTVNTQSHRNSPSIAKLQQTKRLRLNTLTVQTMHNTSNDQNTGYEASNWKRWNVEEFSFELWRTWWALSLSAECLKSGREQPDHNWSGHEDAIIPKDRDRSIFTAFDEPVEGEKGLKALCQMVQRPRSSISEKHCNRVLHCFCENAEALKTFLKTCNVLSDVRDVLYNFQNEHIIDSRFTKTEGTCTNELSFTMYSRDPC